MLYTQEYLEAVEKAICDLQSGKRVTSVAYGDTHVQYAPIWKIYFVFAAR